MPFANALTLVNLSAFAAALVIIVDSAALARVQTSPVPDTTIEAALDWYEAAGLDADQIASLPVDERARRLTQAVYAHCEQGTQSVSDIDELFQECVTACGGFSYVLRGLLEATGAQTRYVNLYNIPNQGNHTAVEVKINGHWAFYDPTFGVYFTEDGDPRGRILSLREITANYTEEGLADRVNQAREARLDILEQSMGELFSGEFDHPFMSLKNYQLAEARSRLDSRELVILDIPLELTGGTASIGDFEARTMADAQAAWLQQTNALLVDNDLSNDVSYLSHRLSNNQGERLTTISVSGLRPEQRYELTLLFFAAADSEVQIASLGRTAFFGGRNVIPIEAGRTIQVGPFVAVENMAQFAVRNLDDTGTVGLLGVEVRRLDGGRQ
ncbi:transglutaminase domain-containing protein [Hyphobacterium indicum]|uniref:transglutaminase domain-containing protein n=1 Tax=Hyphobacterium indicum TaxID=2162714 RepID=UPI000D658B4E|nr:transglutaminase domain-containing protein [Hyphobacterium indicum]